MIFVSAFLFRLIVQRCLTNDAIDNMRKAGFDRLQEMLPGSSRLVVVKTADAELLSRANGKRFLMAVIT